MKRTLIFCMGLSAAIGLQAQQITWVASNGVDSLSCGAHSSPCATFQQAHDNSAAGGVVMALDPAASYGVVTISKAITINGGGGAVILASPASGPAITVASGPTDLVTITGVTINMSGGGTGIFTARPVQLHLEGITITGNPTIGIQAAPSGKPGGAGTGGTLTIEHLTVSGAGTAITTEADVVVIRDSVIKHNTSGIQVLGLSFGVVGSFGGSATITGCEISFNGTGVVADASSSGGNPVTAWIGNSVISGNGTGISQVGGGNVISFRTNMFTGNGVDGVPALSTSMK